MMRWVFCSMTWMPFMSASSSLTSVIASCGARSISGRRRSEPETFSGLAGMGDLIATATSRHSRNRRLGEAIGRGATLQEALAASPMVAEGVGTAQAAVDLAARCGVELPIAEQVRAILYEGKSALAAMRELLARDLKPEAKTISRR